VAGHVDPPMGRDDPRPHGPSRPARPEALPDSDEMGAPAPRPSDARGRFFPGPVVSTPSFVVGCVSRIPTARHAPAVRTIRSGSCG
jgi:hypothetical protein